MSIYLKVIMTHASTGFSAASTATRTNIGDALCAGEFTIPSNEVTLDLAGVTVPKEVFLKNKSNNVVRVGFETGVYPLALSLDDTMVLNLANVLEKSSITTVADSSSDLAGVYFTFASDDTFGVWYKVNDVGAEPAALDATDHVIAVASVAVNATAAVVAAATYAALIASSDFNAHCTATYTAGSAVILITDKTPGARTIVNTQDSGFTVARITKGSSATSVYCISDDAAGSEVMIFATSV